MKIKFLSAYIALCCIYAYSFFAYATLSIYGTEASTGIKNMCGLLFFGTRYIAITCTAVIMAAGVALLIKRKHVHWRTDIAFASIFAAFVVLFNSGLNLNVWVSYGFFAFTLAASIFYLTKLWRRIQ